MAPTTIPAMAPPERPESELFVGEGDVVELDRVPEFETLEEVGALEVVVLVADDEDEDDVLDASSFSMSTGKVEAAGEAEEREEKVAFDFSWLTSAHGFGW